MLCQPSTFKTTNNWVEDKRSDLQFFGDHFIRRSSVRKLPAIIRPNSVCAFRKILLRVSRDLRKTVGPYGIDAQRTPARVQKRRPFHRLAKPLERIVLQTQVCEEIHVFLQINHHALVAWSPYHSIRRVNNPLCKPVHCKMEGRVRQKIPFEYFANAQLVLHHHF